MIALCRDKTSGSRTIAEVVAYGALHQRNRDSDLPLFHSDEYRRAASLALDYPRLNKELAQEGDGLNVYGYPYNSLAFEWPYVARHFDLGFEDGAAELWGVQCALMGDPQSRDLTRNNPDVETFDVKTYEIIHAIEV